MDADAGGDSVGVLLSDPRVFALSGGREFVRGYRARPEGREYTPVVEYRTESQTWTFDRAAEVWHGIVVAAKLAIWTDPDRLFELHPASVKGSPLEVDTIDLDVTSDGIVDLVRESRRRG